MKNASSLKSKNIIESPKTPGGISKSLLTPCRRLGLSRKWRKSGPSPFVSPLASTNNITEPKQKLESRKRKKLSPDNAADNPQIKGENEDDNFVISTPTTKSIQAFEDSSITPKRSNLQRKKSKSLLIASDNLENIKESDGCVGQGTEIPTNTTYLHLKNTDKPVLKLCKTSSKSKIRTKTSLEILHKNETQMENSNLENNIEPPKIPQNKEQKHKNPNNLTKECIVVIQNKILKSNQNKIHNSDETFNSQVLFDSDSDDVPLCQINKNEIMNKEITVSKNMSPVKAAEEILSKEENKSISEKISNVKKNTKLSRNKPNDNIDSKPPSQSSNSFNDDDDFDFIPKKTIIVKKTYNKVTKPVKAKSTGSITDKDIEEIAARIEAKKKLLLARSINPETEDLRGLIKKWQQGCQDALMDLMQLMKKQMPEQSLGNSEILQMLKIPPDLVGYDSENDCFDTPNDEQIILTSLKMK